MPTDTEETKCPAWFSHFLVMRCRGSYTNSLSCYFFICKTGAIISAPGNNKESISLNCLLLLLPNIPVSKNYNILMNRL